MYFLSCPFSNIFLLFFSHTCILFVFHVCLQPICSPIFVPISASAQFILLPFFSFLSTICPHSLLLIWPSSYHLFFQVFFLPQTFLLSFGCRLHFDLLHSCFSHLLLPSFVLSHSMLLLFSLSHYVLFWFHVLIFCIFLHYLSFQIHFIVVVYRIIVCFILSPFSSPRFFPLILWSSHSIFSELFFFPYVCCLWFLIRMLFFSHPLLNLFSHSVLPHFSPLISSSDILFWPFLVSCSFLIVFLFNCFPFLMLFFLFASSFAICNFVLLSWFSPVFICYVLLLSACCSITTFFSSTFSSIFFFSNPLLLSFPLFSDWFCLSLSSSILFISSLIIFCYCSLLFLFHFHFSHRLLLCFSRSAIWFFSQSFFSHPLILSSSPSLILKSFLLLLSFFCLFFCICSPSLLDQRLLLSFFPFLILLLSSSLFLIISSSLVLFFHSFLPFNFSLAHPFLLPVSPFFICVFCHSVFFNFPRCSHVCLRNLKGNFTYVPTCWCSSAGGCAKHVGDFDQASCGDYFTLNNIWFKPVYFSLILSPFFFEKKTRESGRISFVHLSLPFLLLWARSPCDLCLSSPFPFSFFFLHFELFFHGPL